jgi:hypothetical protein
VKTIDEILKQEPVFLNDWSDKINVVSDFEGLYMTKEEYESENAPYANEEYWLEKKNEMKNALEGKYKNANILFASYGCANYTGDAWVLFERGGKLYEVNGGH